MHRNPPFLIAYIDSLYYDAVVRDSFRSGQIKRFNDNGLQYYLMTWLSVHKGLNASSPQLQGKFIFPVLFHGEQILAQAGAAAFCVLHKTVILVLPAAKLPFQLIPFGIFPEINLKAFEALQLLCRAFYGNIRPVKMADNAFFMGLIYRNI